MINELVYGARVAEADFGFGRMDVHVDQRWIDFEKQADGWLAGAVEDVAVGFAQRVANDLVTNEAAVDEDILAVLGLTGAGRVDGEAGQYDWPGDGVDRARCGDEVVADDLGDAPGAVGRG